MRRRCGPGLPSPDVALVVLLCPTFGSWRAARKRCAIAELLARPGAGRRWL